ncbi:MAG: hypothetical protein J5522_01185 [Lachnospiraceae bacterium]|nr:hypothetical protein [Lachnospiraceae bacterium]
MAILTKEELFKVIQGKLTDSDDDLTILENVTDTINSMENTENEDWKKKYEENEKAWRKRYYDRFSEPVKPVEKDIHLPEPEEDDKPKSADFTIDDLFKD